jgi:hypothetical protein
MKRKGGWVREMNMVQRAGLFVSGAALILLLVAHNPIEGYTTEEVHFVDLHPTVPPPTEEQLLNAATKDDLEKLTAQNNAAQNIRIETVEYPFLMWRSDGAFFSEVSTIKSLLLFSTTIVLIASLWLLVFALRRRSSFAIPLRKSRVLVLHVPHALVHGPHDHPLRRSVLHYRIASASSSIVTA